MPFSGAEGALQSETATSARGREGKRGYRLLAITRKIVDTRTLAIFFFGSPTFNLIVSVLVTEPALNLKQKAERL
jgi:hypothetical protein